MASKPNKKSKNKAREELPDDVGPETSFTRLGPVRFPGRIEMSGTRVSLQVHSHVVPKLGPVWLFMTWGMDDGIHFTPEIVMVLRRRAGEEETDIPKGVLGFFWSLASVWSVRKDGGLDFDTVWDAEPDWLQGPGIAGIGFVSADMLTGPEQGGAALFPGSLLAVGLDAAELRTARRFGIWRVMARRGAEEGKHPYPGWTDRDRTPRLTESAEAQSELSQVLCRKPCRILLLEEKQTLQMLVGGYQQDELSKLVGRLPADESFALFAEPPVNGDPDDYKKGWRVWSPGQAEPTVLWPEGKKRGLPITGFHILFQVEAGEDRVYVHEDGWAMKLLPETWKRLRAALLQKLPVSTPATEGSLAFELSWEKPYGREIPPGEGEERDEEEELH